MAKKVFTEEEARERKNARQREYAKRTSYASSTKYEKDTVKRYVVKLVVTTEQDIIDAIDYCISEENVDTDNIFLLGASGGGHMALLMAGFKPEYFKAIGAFVGITDLKRWSEENLNYREHVLACCNNDEKEMAKRSPMSYIDSIATSNTKIFHGKYDPSVPVSQSIRIFNAINEKYPKAKVYLDIFDGGHEMDMEVAMKWLMSQYDMVEKEEVTG